MPLPLNKTIKDHYLISQVISTKGDFGNTYLAYDDLRKQDIVIKESRPPPTSSRTHCWWMGRHSLEDHQR